MNKCVFYQLFIKSNLTGNNTLYGPLHTGVSLYHLIMAQLRFLHQIDTAGIIKSINSGPVWASVESTSLTLKILLLHLLLLVLRAGFGF